MVVSPGQDAGRSLQPLDCLAFAAVCPLAVPDNEHLVQYIGSRCYSDCGNRSRSSGTPLAEFVKVERAAAEVPLPGGFVLKPCQNLKPAAGGLSVTSGTEDSD